MAGSLFWNFFDVLRQGWKKRSGHTVGWPGWHLMGLGGLNLGWELSLGSLASGLAVLTRVLL